eukprot:2249157-Pyramimonas_sp.AAC.1
MGLEYTLQSEPGQSTTGAKQSAVDSADGSRVRINLTVLPVSDWSGVRIYPRFLRLIGKA